MAAGGVYARRSIQIFRMVLRAALDEAVAEGRLRRSPAARVGMPRVVVKADRVREVPAWTEDDVRKFLAAVKDHRWYGPIRLDVLYGLRRSELLGLKWGDIDLKAGTVRIERGLTEVGGVPTWTDGKNARSRRTIPIDPTTAQHLGAHRRRQAEERLAAGSTWVDNDLLVASRTGTVVSPGNFDQTLERLVLRAGVPRLTSHGLRHTAATHMVRHASDIGEIRAAADLLGHSPDMLMRTYAHALPGVRAHGHRQDRPARRRLLIARTTRKPRQTARRRAPTGSRALASGAGLAGPRRPRRGSRARRAAEGQ